MQHVGVDKAFLCWGCVKGGIDLFYTVLQFYYYFYFFWNNKMSTGEHWLDYGKCHNRVNLIIYYNFGVYL